MYTKPELMLEQFEVEDIITTSDNPTTTTNDPFEIENLPVENLEIN